MVSRAKRRGSWRLLRVAVLWTALPVLLLVWTSGLPPVTRALVSTAYVAFLLVAAPVWCGAVNRDGRMCRNNANGLLVGCHLRQHRWQKLTSFRTGDRARQVVRGWFGNALTGTAVLGVVVGIVSATAAWVEAIKT